MKYKFRGKSKNGDFHIYGMPTYDLKYIFNGSDEQYASPDNYEVMSETIVPYIGRNDDNGREMYSGDTVKVDCSGVGGSFNDGVYRIEYSEVDCAFFLVQLDGKHAIAFNECYGYEVIENK